MITAAAFLAGAAAGGGAVWAWRRRSEKKFARVFSFAMHELNTPITAVNMTVLNLLSDVFGELPPALKPWVEMTREQVGRLNGLVGEVRDFVHMELHEDLRVGSAEMSAQEIVDEALISIARGMEQAGVEFKSSVEPGLPALRVDPDRAARCLTSALFHARKFRTSGGIELKAVRAPAGAAFVVSYDGPRLPPGAVRDSLDLYYPARRGKSQTLGATGLGLGLVREVARLSGGDLDYHVDDAGRSRLTLTYAGAA